MLRKKDNIFAQHKISEMQPKMKKDRTPSQRSNGHKKNQKLLSEDHIQKASKETTKEKIYLRIHNKSTHSKFESYVDEVKHKDSFPLPGQPRIFHSKRKSQNTSHRQEPSIGQLPCQHTPNLFKHVKKRDPQTANKPGLPGLGDKTGFSFRRAKEAVRRQPQLELEKFARTMG